MSQLRLLMLWIWKCVPDSSLWCFRFFQMVFVKVYTTRVTSSWFLLACSCFQFVFIKSWIQLEWEWWSESLMLWGTRWVSVLVVISPSELFYSRVIDGSASFGDPCKDQMASVSRRGVPVLLIDVLCMISWCFLGLSLFWSRWPCMKLLVTDISMAGMSSPFSLNHLSTMWCLVMWFFKSDASLG